MDHIRRGRLDQRSLTDRLLVLIGASINPFSCAKLFVTGSVFLQGLSRALLPILGVMASENQKEALERLHVDMKGPILDQDRKLLEAVFLATSGDYVMRGRAQQMCGIPADSFVFLERQLSHFCTPMLRALYASMLYTLLDRLEKVGLGEISLNAKERKKRLFGEYGALMLSGAVEEALMPGKYKCIQSPLGGSLTPLEREKLAVNYILRGDEEVSLLKLSNEVENGKVSIEAFSEEMQQRTGGDPIALSWKLYEKFDSSCKNSTKEEPDSGTWKIPFLLRHQEFNLQAEWKGNKRLRDKFILDQLYDVLWKSILSEKSAMRQLI